jgi:hypothetical protein
VRLRLGTRGSALALAQAAIVAEAVSALGAAVEVIPLRTSGDRLAQVALADFGGKALFVREIDAECIAALPRRIGALRIEQNQRRGHRHVRRLSGNQCIAARFDQSGVVMPAAEPIVAQNVA